LTSRAHRILALAARTLPGLALATLFVTAAPTAGHAQLISPGKLSEAHTELEGLRNCTQCHRLGNRGIDPTLCLECHEPLARRVDEQTGYHADLEDPDCASCHKDHFGLDFDVLRFDSLSFDHDEAGFELVDAHGEIDCRDCHEPQLIIDPQVRQWKSEHNALEGTFLGLGRECLQCHDVDDPHAGTFEGEPCSECHTQVSWVAAEGFDHDRDTEYSLTGRHRDQECVACHTNLPARSTDGAFGSDQELRFDGLEFGTCTSCHEDEHDGAMGPTCETCHSTTDWLEVDTEQVTDRFDHSTTRFDLVGSHASLDCASCHEPQFAATLFEIRMSWDPATLGRAFPHADFAECASCHVDPHDAALSVEPGWNDCTACHNDDAWRTWNFDFERHNEETDYTLEGAHLLAPCASCHEVADDRGLMVFDTELPETCATCHAEDNVHGDQFVDRTCDSCHGIDAFAGVEIDHDATRFPLDGAHEQVDCVQCHEPEPDGSGGTMIRYRPLAIDCAACHGSLP
jgi:hypothetical protein